MKKKGIFTFVLTALLAVFAAAPAFAAAGVSAAEEELYAEFCGHVEDYRGVIGNETADQYEAQALAALASVDLTDAACKEFSQAIKDVMAVIDSNPHSTRSELMKVAPQCVEIVNKVGTKYGVTISVAAHGLVTITINGQVVAQAGTSTVKQTGFGLAQTAAVAGASIAVLAGAFVVSRKLA